MNRVMTSVVAMVALSAFSGFGCSDGQMDSTTNEESSVAPAASEQALGGSSEQGVGKQQSAIIENAGALEIKRGGIARKDNPPQRDGVWTAALSSGRDLD